MSVSAPRFDNSYVRLPARLYARQLPEAVSQPETIRVNEGLARKLGFDPKWLAAEEGAAVVAGSALLPGSEPIATAYAGHQFGHFNPKLGDGRAVLLGEVLTENQERFDLQLKGSGRTPFSRGGDGRCPLGPALREALVSESMYAMGIPTTRVMAVAMTGERVVRDAVLPGAVLVRVADSHIRIGTFEYLAAQGDLEGLEALLGHACERHISFNGSTSEMAESLLSAVVQRQASLIAQWQLVGFVHGVMNTDNMLICGQTIDYGPCAFMNEYDPGTVFSSIDRHGRYAYGNQPRIAGWNLVRLARALLPLLGEEDEAVARAQGAIDGFPGFYADAHRAGLAKKLGLTELHEDDDEWIQSLLDAMHEAKADFTLTFRRLANLAGGASEAESAVVGALEEGLGAWVEQWVARLAEQPMSAQARGDAMREVNPILIPRNHQVEAALQSATEGEGFERFHRLADAIERPYDFRPEVAEYLQPPTSEQRVHQTFCGT